MALTPIREDEAVELMQMEYAEMPDLKLTFFQAQRLWNLSPDLCDRALGALVKAAFLVRTSDGAYVRGTATRPSGRGSSAARLTARAS